MPVFAFFCGRAALYDAATGSWREIHGGPLDEEIWSDAYRDSIKLWRFADLVPAGDVVLAAAEGITLNRKGIACYGCEGSPVSFWTYRPPPEVTTEPTQEQPVTRRAARHVAEDFMCAGAAGSAPRTRAGGCRSRPPALHAQSPAD